ncbi:hypothetical protein QAD02_008083 [Eretmocerus hayati]|uniref:Uncharacterized protein n=1 Tax=Eretmocerus hayati TaxID=131215 RepID=A0ACC2N6A6_9HYME|nr:hypothetical protein QAD02_008083 [Eretmocerus hayati]
MTKENDLTLTLKRPLESISSSDIGKLDSPNEQSAGSMLPPAKISSADARSKIVKPLLKRKKSQETNIVDENSELDEPLQSPRVFNHEQFDEPFKKSRGCTDFKGFVAKYTTDPQGIIDAVEKVYDASEKDTKGRLTRMKKKT